MVYGAHHSSSIAPSSHHGGGEQPIYAALDLGTNNCRLLIARHVPTAAQPYNIRVLDSFSRIVRLGEEMGAQKRLSEEAMERTIRALHNCKRKIEKFHITRSRFVTTEACRQATNSEEFLARVRREVGIDIEIIPTSEEAKLAFVGCAMLMAPQPPYALIFDIGGGSTEVLWVKIEAGAKGHSPFSHTVLDWFSLDRGVMNLSEAFGGHHMADQYYTEMVDLVTRQLADFNTRNQISEAIAQGQVQMLSTSGTVTTLAAIHLDLPRYDRTRIDGLTLSRQELVSAAQNVQKMRASERFAHPCIGSDRSDFIVSGCALFDAVTTLWPVPHMTIADRGVREGIVISLMQPAE